MFKLWLEANKNEEIIPEDLYDFYYIFTALVNDKIHDEHIRPAEFRIKEIKDKYLQQFQKLVLDQLVKYHTQNRIDSDFPSIHVISSLPLLKQFEYLDQAMRKTFRSDMQRRNTNWELITDNLKRLSMTNNFSRIAFHIDRINNSIHNKKELVLDKFHNGHELLTALDNIHKAMTPREYSMYVSPQIRKFVNFW